MHFVYISKKGKEILPEQQVSSGEAVCRGMQHHGEEFCPTMSLKHKEEDQEVLRVQKTYPKRYTPK